MDVAADFGFIVPVGMEIFVENEALVDDVFEMALPAMAAFVGGEAVEDRLIRGFLQVDIDRRVNLQAAFVDLVGSVLAFEVAANFLDVRAKCWPMPTIAPWIPRSALVKYSELAAGPGKRRTPCARRAQAMTDFLKNGGAVAYGSVPADAAPMPPRPLSARRRRRGHAATRGRKPTPAGEIR